MFYNFLGKLMVQCHLVISVAALAWAASVYLEMVDWGWKVPKKELDYAIASKFDVATAQNNVTYRQRDLIYPDLKPSYEKLREAEEAYVRNNLAYDRELARLVFGDEPIEVRQINLSGGFPVLDLPEIGKPEFQEKPLADVKKTLESYRRDLKKVGQESDRVEKEYGAWLDKQKEVSLKLGGRVDAKNRKVRAGLIDMREAEVDAQKQLREEMHYLRPREIDFRKEAEIYRDRRENLEESLKRVKTGLRKGAKIGGPG